MREIISMPFFVNAIAMCVIMSLLFGMLSFFVVLRRMSFLGAGVAHTAFGGVALGLFLGIDPFFASLAFCVLAAVTLGRLVSCDGLSYDAGIGIFFAFSMALGAILIAVRKAYSFDLMGYLFGNILGVTTFDTVMAAIALVLLYLFVGLYLHRLLFMSFDEDVASTSGVRTGALDTLLLALMAAVIITGIKVVGIILISALVVLPASFGLLLSKNFRLVIAWGILYTFAIMTGGLALSFVLDTPTGATIVSLGTALYFLAMAFVRIFMNK